MTISTSESRALDGDAGVEGNSRITAVTGLVLTALLLIEGVTILDTRGMLTLHMYLGLMLVPPVLLKCATTMYRFGSYYAGQAPYVRRGPPHIVLRVLGPLVILSSLAVLGTGVWLIVLGRRDDSVVSLHQASFIVWLVVVGLHFLGHLPEAVKVSLRELRPPPGDRARTQRRLRVLAVVASLIVGVGVAAAFTPSNLTSFRSHDHGFGNH